MQLRELTAVWVTKEWRFYCWQEQEMFIVLTASRPCLGHTLPLVHVYGGSSPQAKATVCRGWE
jgi:glycerol-3-phosphate acyltransferase PlsY